ncbi:MAG: hypothetical protein ACREK5_00355 [Gemmatimonadota bacterium]
MRLLAGWALGVLVVGAVACSGGGSYPGFRPPSGGLLVTRCQTAVRQGMIDEIGAAGVDFVSGQSLAVNPEVTNVQGEANVRPQRGPTQRHTYLCTFHTQEGNRLARFEYDRKDQAGGGTPPPTADLRDLCATALEEKLRYDQGAAVNNYRGRGEVIKVNPQVTNVQGEAEVQPQKGPSQLYAYLCTFYPQENNRLVRVKYDRK